MGTSSSMSTVPMYAEGQRLDVGADYRVFADPVRHYPTSLEGNPLSSTSLHNAFIEGSKCRIYLTTDIIVRSYYFLREIIERSSILIL